MGGNDEDYSSNSFRVLVFVGLLFIVAAFMSWQEFRFATVGREAPATISKIREQTDRFGTTSGYNVYYDFLNENTKKAAHHFTLISPSDVDRYSEGQQVTIDYYGEKYATTRLHGANYRGWVYFFFASLTALVSVTAYLAIKTAREDQRPKRKSARH